LRKHCEQLATSNSHVDHLNTPRLIADSTGATVSRNHNTDPIGLGAGLNTYAYVGSNPLSYVDPKGLIAAPTGQELKR
jgi:uncharacterized protein RhaS with RHS repeats